MFSSENNSSIWGKGYLYRKLTKEIYQPLGKFIFAETQFKNAPLSVTIDDVQYFDTASIKISKDKNFIYLGKCISLTNLRNDKIGNLTFNFRGSPQEIINGLHFYKALKTGHILRLGDIAYADNLSINFSIDLINKTIDFYSKISTLFEKLHITTDVDFSLFTDEDLDVLQKLYTCIVLNKPLIPNGQLKSGRGRQKLGKLILELVLIADNKKCQYHDFFDETKFTYKIPDTNGHIYKSSVYTMLNKKDFIELSNIDYEAIKRSIFQIPYNAIHGDRVNTLILEMLKAYDITKNELILNTVIAIANWLKGNNENLIYTLNYFQSIRRKRSLTEDERHKLMDISRAQTDYKNLAGISAILGNKEEYEYYLSKLKTDEKKDFQKYPITYLMK